MIKSRRGLAAAIVTLAGLTLAGVMFFAGRQPSSQLYKELAAQVTLALEQSSLDEHHAHGHDFDSRVVCAVETFGTDPPNATSVVEVKWVYARHMCAVTGAGTDWATSVRASGPIAVRIGIPPVVQVPEPGMGYPDRVRRLIPARYQDEAFAEFDDEDAIDAARQRFTEIKKAQAK
ncbi:hypothetical protein [Nonomuraea sp. CA-141351]|uniref:hypothetical protein n=1 Tax=Nonomuraea sp. CA-141351 TaxID=3239996 RepID=UPI003D8CB0B2